MRHKLRTLLVAWGVAGLITSVAACGAIDTGSGDQSSGQSTKQSGFTGQLRIAMLTDQPYVKDAVGRFKKANPGLNVQYTEAPSNTYQATIRSQLAAGHGPDVMFVWGGSGNAMATKILAKAGLLADLSDSPWAKSVPTEADALVSQEGKTYALNSFQNPTGVVYDKAKMAALGVKPPTTFTDLLNFCKTVSSKGIVPIAMGNQTGYLNIEVPLELANDLIYSKDPTFGTKAASGKINWTDNKLWNDSVRTSLNKYMQMNDAKCFQDNTTGFSDTQAISLVTSGKALGVDVIGSSYPSIIAANNKLHYDMFALPATDNASDTWLTSNPGAAWAVAEKSSNREAAIAFINYMGTHDQLSVAAKVGYGLPYAASKDTPVPPEFSGVESLYKSHKNALWATNYWPNADVKQDMIAASQNLILGKGTVDDVLTAMRKAYAGD